LQWQYKSTIIKEIRDKIKVFLTVETLKKAGFLTDICKLGSLKKSFLLSF